MTEFFDRLQRTHSLAHAGAGPGLTAPATRYWVQVAIIELLFCAAISVPAASVMLQLS